jgi:hypothetical protein
VKRVKISKPWAIKEKEFLASATGGLNLLLEYGNKLTYGILASAACVGNLLLEHGKRLCFGFGRVSVENLLPRVTVTGRWVKPFTKSNSNKLTVLAFGSKLIEGCRVLRETVHEGSRLVQRVNRD